MTRRISTLRYSARILDRLRGVLRDIAQGRGIEGYATFAIGTVVSALDLAGKVSTGVMLGVLLFVVSFLVFHTSSSGRGAARPEASYAQVLHDRADLPFFPGLLDDVRDLRVYGPTAINILVHAGAIERRVLCRGGTVRVVVQAFDPVQLDLTAVQLDQSLDLKETLRTSHSSLRRLGRLPGFDYRLLAFNPGFSILAVNADRPEGYVIVEVHGFGDNSFHDRMHVRIKRTDAPRWFGYWIERFEAIWDAASLDPARGGPRP